MAGSSSLFRRPRVPHQDVAAVMAKGPRHACAQESSPSDRVKQCPPAWRSSRGHAAPLPPAAREARPFHVEHAERRELQRAPATAGKRRQQVRDAQGRTRVGTESRVSRETTRSPPKHGSHHRRRSEPVRRRWARASNATRDAATARGGAMGASSTDDSAPNGPRHREGFRASCQRRAEVRRERAHDMRRRRSSVGQARDAGELGA